MSRPACELTATEAAGEIAAGRLTPRALAESCLAQTVEREPSVRAFAFLDADLVRAAAAALEDVPAAQRGPLHGIPTAFKDIMDTSMMPTCYNSPIYAGHRPTADASVVALTRAAGGVVFGKAVTAEFANRAPGQTTNPHNPAHTPGGSSSGSAAAVAACMVPLALGTQTSGSAIRPAAYCGVHGFKGSWGEISYAGIKLTSATMDTVGIYARSLADIALYRSVLTGIAPVKFTPGNLAMPRIGVCHTRFADQATSYTHALIDEVAGRAEQAGAHITSFELPRHFDELLDAHRWVSSYEGARSLAWEKSFHRDRISADLREGRIQDGESCSAELYRSSARFGERCRLEFDEVLGDADVLLTPSAPGEAPLGLKATGSAVFNTLWTFLHVPCVTIPGGSGPGGLPLGFQLIGRRGSDRRLLDIARWIEQAVRR